MPQERREVTEKNRAWNVVPLPRRPPAKKELFWIIQPCPATQEGRLQPGRGIHFRSRGLRASQKGGMGKSGQPYSPRPPQTGWGRGWRGCVTLGLQYGPSRPC